LALRRDALPVEEVGHHGRHESARALVIPAQGHDRSRHRHTADHNNDLDAVHGSLAGNSTN